MYKKHYIYEYNRDELLDFHGDKSLIKMDTNFILKACIDQILYDHDADNRYKIIDGILYEKT